jgi:hypothetical protein
MRNDNRGKDIFYGVVAIATLIVAIIGATLAYFSVTASSNEGAVNATAAIVSIEYNDGQQVTAQAKELIPATLEVVQQVYESKVATLTHEDLTTENVCIDRNDRQVCSAYRFTVRSDVERTITATLNNEHNGFTYLSYAVYDITNGVWLELNDEGAKDLALTTCSNENEDETDDCFAINPKKYEATRAVNSIFGYTLDKGVSVKQTKTVASDTHEYELILFIKENDENQNIDQGKNFRGTIIVDVIDGGKNGQISGCVGDDCVE